MIRTTTASKVIQCLEKMFCTHGLPIRVRSDNDPQFTKFMCDNGISKVFPTGCIQMGKLKIIIKLYQRWPESKKFRREVEQFLFSYRSTPHCTAGVLPTELLFDRQLRTKIPTVTQLDEWVECESYRDQQVSDVIARDTTAKKQYNKGYRDNKLNAKSHVCPPEEEVLLRYQRRADKMTPFYEAAPYEVVDVNGSTILLQGEDGKAKMCDAAHMKGFNTVPDQLRYQPLPTQQ